MSAHAALLQDVDAALCRACGARSDWHAADDGQCPDDDNPHPYSYAADALERAAGDRARRAYAIRCSCDGRDS